MMDHLMPGLSAAPNLHPMVVHFPIAFWLAAAGAWVIALLRSDEGAWRFGLWLHSLGLAGGALAVAFGFWATVKMGHDSPGHDLVHVHRDLMLWTTGLAVIVTAVGWWKRGTGVRKLLTGLSLLLAGLLSLGADRGAELVFRYGMGVAGEAPPAAGHAHGHGDDEHGHGPPTEPPAAANNPQEAPNRPDPAGEPADRTTPDARAVPAAAQKPPRREPSRKPAHSHDDHAH